MGFGGEANNLLLRLNPFNRQKWVHKEVHAFSAANIDFQPLPSTTLFIPLELISPLPCTTLFLPLEFTSPLPIYHAFSAGIDFPLTLYHAFSSAGIDFTLTLHQVFFCCWNWLHPYPLSRFFCHWNWLSSLPSTTLFPDAGIDPYSPDSQCGAKSITVTQREKRLREMEGRLSLSLC